MAISQSRHLSLAGMDGGTDHIGGALLPPWFSRHNRLRGCFAVSIQLAADRRHKRDHGQRQREEVAWMRLACCTRSWCSGGAPACSLRNWLRRSSTRAVLFSMSAVAIEQSIFWLSSGGLT